MCCPAIWPGGGLRVAIGDMALSCTEGLIQSLTFVFNDGSIHTVSRRSNGTTPTSGGGGAGAASGGKRSLAEAPKLGYVSDRYGNPCIPGRFVTNAPAYLTDIVGLRTLSLAGKGGRCLADHAEHQRLRRGEQLDDRQPRHLHSRRGGLRRGR